jgi:hypothetical protein
MWVRVQLPPIHLLPIQNRKKPTSGVYLCPVYKVRNIFCLRAQHLPVCRAGA